MPFLKHRKRERGPEQEKQNPMEKSTNVAYSHPTTGRPASHQVRSQPASTMKKGDDAAN